MSQKIKQTVVAVIIVIVAFVGFKKFFGDGVSSDTTLTTESNTAQFVDGQSILILLNQLNKVTLNEDIFSSPIFSGLVNFTKPIPDQVLGRSNPFSAIGNENSSTPVAATSSPKTK